MTELNDFYLGFGIVIIVFKSDFIFYRQNILRTIF